MAGGTFDAMVKKKRPATYINIISAKKASIGTATSGAMALPLINPKYGSTGEFIKITNAAPDAAHALLGYSVVRDSELLPVTEAFKKVSTIYIYPLTGSTKKATGKGGGLKATAKKAGSRGNDFKYTITANPVSGFDITVYLGVDKVGLHENVTTVADLAVDDYLDWAADGEDGISAVLSVNLAGGEDAAATAQMFTEFLDKLEDLGIDSFAWPVSGESAASLKAAAKAKVLYLYESCGKRVHAAIPNYASDCQFVLNVTNGVALSDGTQLDAVNACYWVAAAYAGASYTTSNTYVEYEGAVGIVGKKSNDEAIEAIDNGEFFFSMSEDGKVIVEYDINSLTTFSNGVSEDFRKNRVQRVFDTIHALIKSTFPPNRFDNDPTGWNVMEGLGADMLNDCETDGAIKNVDTDADFKVDRTKSDGDSTYFDVNIQPVDSAEKLYFSIKSN